MSFGATRQPATSCSSASFATHPCNRRSFHAAITSIIILSCLITFSAGDAEAVDFYFGKHKDTIVTALPAAGMTAGAMAGGAMGGPAGAAVGTTVGEAAGKAAQDALKWAKTVSTNDVTLAGPAGTSSGMGSDIPANLPPGGLVLDPGAMNSGMASHTRTINMDAFLNDGLFYSIPGLMVFALFLYYIARYIVEKLSNFMIKRFYPIPSLARKFIFYPILAIFIFLGILTLNTVFILLPLAMHYNVIDAFGLSKIISIIWNDWYLSNIVFYITIFFTVVDFSMILRKLSNGGYGFLEIIFAVKKLFEAVIGKRSISTGSIN